MENAEIKTKTGEDLKTMLEEFYAWYFKKAQEADRDTDHPGENYAIGKLDGACEALDCIIFHLYGGKAAFRNWLTNIGEPDNTIKKMINEAFPDDPSTGS